MDTRPTRATRQLQAALISFFVFVTISLVVVYAVEPGIYAAVTGLAAPLLLVPLLLFESLLVVGTLRRWRWLFWLILVAFGFSALRVPLLALELAGVLPLEQPLWYNLYRTLIAVLQAGIALWMAWLYRRQGVWACGGR
jgi:hypothetical protein